MGAIGEGKGNNKTAWVTWIHTPATCKECGHYDKNKNRGIYGENTVGAAARTQEH